MAVHLKDHRAGFGPGRTAITTLDESEDPTGIALSVLKLDAGQVYDETVARETAWLLMTGAAHVELETPSKARGAREVAWERTSLFDELPRALHGGAGTRVRIRCESPTELTIYETLNTRPFAPRFYDAKDVRDEHRGKGQVRDACYRFVRTIFDATTSDPTAELVLGEVITLPGRWSSYPPHHHPQPEIYHYRFTEPQGYGHAELGEDVLKVRNNDTVKILHRNDHSQAAAPGYGMYYSWVIRHLPNQPYDVPEFTPEHRWVMEPGAETWWPEGLT